MSDIVIAAAKRTAIGSFLGQFTGVPTPTLGAAAISAALAQSGVPAADVSEVIMGCVLPANLGQAPARQASLAAGLPMSTGCTTINKVCGSGMKAIMLGHDLIKAGSATIVVAGGMESMTNAPHLMPNARTGNRFGNARFDHMSWDGLANPYDGQAMGVFADATAEKYGFTREAQDAYTHRIGRPRAGCAEVAAPSTAKSSPVKVSYPQGRNGIRHRRAARQVRRQQDPDPAARLPQGRHGHRRQLVEHLGRCRRYRLMTPSEAPPGAAAGRSRGSSATARHAQEPEWFTTAPVGAIEKLLDKVGWKLARCRPVRDQRGLRRRRDGRDQGTGHSPRQGERERRRLRPRPPDRRVRRPPVVTLIHALRKRGGKRGVASLCIGGGEATAIAIEVL